MNWIILKANVINCNNDCNISNLFAVIVESDINHIDVIAIWYNLEEDAQDTKPKKSLNGTIDITQNGG